MYEFEYHRPTSLDDAAGRLSDEDAKLVWSHPRTDQGL